MLLFPARIVLIFAGLAAALAAQATLAVPSQFVTIQAAIGAAQNGDIIAVAPGTYAENLVVASLTVEIVGVGGADQTVLDGQGQGTVVDIRGPSSVTLSGLTIRNGYGWPVGASTGAISEPRAGGVQFGGTDLVVEDCIIRDNVGGAGYQVFPLPPAGTLTVLGGSGGFGCKSGTIQLARCLVLNNTAGPGATGLMFSPPGSGGAGGVGFDGTALVVEDSEFRGNTGAAGGTWPGFSLAGTGGPGAISILGQVALTRTKFVGNTGGTSGFGASLLVPASDGPGACRVFGAGVFSARDCLFANNSAPLAGLYATAGAVDAAASSPTVNIVGCTVADNTSTGGRGALHLLASAFVRNSILAENTPTQLTTPAGAGLSTITDSIVESGVTGPTIVNAAPIFLDPLRQDYRLVYASVGVDMGANSFVTTTNDLEGNVRIAGASVDIGAYETVAPPCASGNSPSAAMPLLTVGGNADFRQVTTASLPVPIAFASPPSQAFSPFVLVAKVGATSLGEATTYPFGVGDFCFDAFAPDAVAIVSSFGPPSILGFAIAPWSYVVPAGLPVELVFTMQGVVVEGTSAIRSNAITLRLTP